MKLLGATLFFAGLLFVSCKKEPTTWNAWNAVPIADGRLHLHDLITDTTITIGADLAYRLTGTYRLLEFDPTAYITIPDTSIIRDLSIPITISVMPGGEFINDIEETKFTDIDAELTELKIHTGKIAYTISNTVPEDLIVTYEIPGSLLNGNPLKYIRTVPAGTPTNPTVTTGDVILDGAFVNLRGTNGNDYNIIQSQVKVQVSPTGSTVTVGPSNVIRVEVEYKDMVPEYVRGYFGNLATTEQSAGDTLELFKSILAGSILIDEAYANLKISNGIGADAQVNILSLEGKNSKLGTSTALNHSVVGNPMNFNRSQENGGNPIAWNTNIAINHTNSNITSFVGMLPDLMAYQVSFELNPLGNISGHNDFYYKGYPFAVDLEIDAPLKAGINGLILFDTLSIQNIGELDQWVETAILDCEISNAFPISAQFKLVLPNATGILSDTISATSTVATGTPGVAHSISPVVSQSSIVVTGEQLERIKTLGKVGIWVKFDTQPTGTIYQLYSNYYVDCKIGLRMKNKLKL